MKKLTAKILGLVLFAFLLIGCNANTDVVSPETELSKSGNISILYPLMAEHIQLHRKRLMD